MKNRWRAAPVAGEPLSVRLIVVRVRDAGAQVEMSVEDDGPGIAEADQARMLEPFKRGEPSRNSLTGGAGLGLTLARAIAEQHGGDRKSVV